MTTAGSAIWLVIIVVSLVTYALRASFLLGIDHVGAFPPAVDRLIAYFPVAILSALIVPGLLLVDGTIVIELTNARLIAGIVAMVVAWYTERILATVGVGMAVFWLLTGLP